MSEPRMFRFDALDRTGVFLGLGLTQLAVLAVGTLTATAALTAGLPLPLAAVPALGAAGSALGRVHGDRIVDLAPVAARWLLRRNRTRWLAPWTCCIPATTRPPAGPAAVPARHPPGRSAPGMGSARRRRHRA